jgi:type IV pilus assembly protein PilY1
MIILITKVYVEQIDKTRNRVMGDIYHSQLIEIGAPDGNTQFTDNNQEAYFRTINNYQAFKASQQSRRNILYAGSNSGLLHASSAVTASLKFDWAFRASSEADISAELEKYSNSLTSP